MVFADFITSPFISLHINMVFLHSIIGKIPTKSHEQNPSFINPISTNRRSACPNPNPHESGLPGGGDPGAFVFRLVLRAEVPLYFSPTVRFPVGCRQLPSVFHFLIRNSLFDIRYSQYLRVAASKPKALGMVS
jgi:hypothetical protein